MGMLDTNTTTYHFFHHAGHLMSYEKLRGYHKRIARDFVRNFDDKKTRVGKLEMEVNVNTIEVTT